MNVDEMLRIPGQLGNSAQSSLIEQIKQANGFNPGEGENELDWLRSKAQAGEDWAIDKYLDYFLSERSTNSARAWTASREDNAYQRLVSDLKKAGINPYFALQGASPISSSTQGVNYQGNYKTSSRKVDASGDNTWTRALATIFGVVLGALLA